MTAGNINAILPVTCCSDRTVGTHGGVFTAWACSPRATGLDGYAADGRYR